MRGKGGAAAVTIAVDSKPLARGVLRARDHSGHIVYGPAHFPLTYPGSFLETPRLVAADRYAPSADGRRHRFRVREGLRWSDGAPLIAADFAAAIARVKSSRTAEAVWLQDVAGLQCRGAWLEIETREPNFLIPHWLGLFALSPTRAAGVGAGRYVVEDDRGDRIILKKNPFHAAAWRSDAERLCYTVIKEPRQNVAAFMRGDVDVTADTAFPYELVAAHARAATFSRSHIGVFAAVTFEGKLAHEALLPLRDFIAGAIDRDALRGALCGVPAAAAHFGPQMLNLALAPCAAATPPIDALKTPLIFAFDDYYPNRRVCEVVAAQLRARGLQVRLVADEYGAPRVQADLRLALFKGRVPGELSVYFGLRFDPILRASPQRSARYAAALERFTRTELRTRALLEETVSQLQDCLDEGRSLIALLELPGLMHSRLLTDPQRLFQPAEEVA